MLSEYFIFVKISNLFSEVNLITSSISLVKWIDNGVKHSKRSI